MSRTSWRVARHGNTMLCGIILCATHAAVAHAQESPGRRPTQEPLAELFRRVHSSVVVIHTAEHEVVPEEGGAVRSFSGLGSGVLVDREGLIATAAHVVHTADAVKIEFATGQVVDADVVASDPISDLALLRLSEAVSGIEPAILADSDHTAVGEDVFVVGAPYGFSHSLTVGYVSGRHVDTLDDLGSAKIEVLQTDAAINEGNSGGPMFNMDGEVVGIVSYIYTQSGGFEGLGFVIASNTVREVLFEHPGVWTGMTGIVVDGPIAKAFNLPQDAGFLVQKIATGSPADRLGLRAGRLPATILDRPILLGGDVILSIDGIPMTPTRIPAIREHLSSIDESDGISVVVFRDGRRVRLEARR